MILDTLENADRYAGLQDGFRQAFAFLRGAARDCPSVGRVEIDGDRLFAVVSDGPGRKREAGQLEVHARYIDIQYVVSGTDEMGWKGAGKLASPSTPLDPEKDVAFYPDAPDAWIPVPAGSFAVFFPEDAHLPLVSEANIRKIVVKVVVSCP